MILTRAYITEIPEVGDNHFKVRVPLMEDNTGTEAIFSALLCSSPSTFNGYTVGDVVYVHFEDNYYNDCVILGKLFTEVPTESSAYVLANELKVTDHAYLPPSTRLGDYTAQDLTNLYSAAANGGSGTGTIDESDLERYVKYIPVRREDESGATKNYFAKNILTMTGAEYTEYKTSPEKKDNCLFFLTSVPEEETQ